MFSETCCRKMGHLFHLVAGLSVVLYNMVAADYPPPSADGHRYYSRRASSGQSQPLVGTGRVSSGFGSVSDWTGTDWGSLNAGGHGLASCVDIPSNLSLCRNMEYSVMRLPNLLEHDTLREVSQQASSWVRLLDARCHADTQVFLCSLFAPICLERPVWPCRSLCEAVKSGCEDRMLRYGFPWPEMLRCDQYPLDDELCIQLRSLENRDGDATVCPACTQTVTYDTIVENFCASDIAMRIKVEQTIVSGDDLKIVAAKKRKLYKSTTAIKSKEARDISMYIEGGARCDCAKLEHSRQSMSYLIMGRKAVDRLMVDSVVLLDQRSREVTRAMRALRDRNLCRRGVRPAAVTTAPAAVGRPKKGNSNRTKRPSASTVPTIASTTPTTPMPRNKQSRNQGGGRRQQSADARRLQ